jgi:hypothetical protein
MEVVAWKRYAKFKFKCFALKFMNAVGPMGSFRTGNWTWRNGTVATNPSTFLNGAGWQVQSNEPSLFHDNRVTHATTTCLRPTGTQGRFNEMIACNQARIMVTHYGSVACSRTMSMLKG